MPLGFRSKRAGVRTDEPTEILSWGNDFDFLSQQISRLKVLLTSCKLGKHQWQEQTRAYEIKTEIEKLESALKRRADGQFRLSVNSWALYVDEALKKTASECALTLYDIVKWFDGDIHEGKAYGEAQGAFGPGETRPTLNEDLHEICLAIPQWTDLFQLKDWNEMFVHFSKSKSSFSDYETTKSQTDIDTATSAGREAVSAIDVIQYPTNATVLLPLLYDNLATILMEKYDSTRRIDVLLEAYGLRYKIVTDAIKTDPNISQYQADLACCMYARYQAKGEKEYLSQAIHLLQRALERGITDEARRIAYIKLLKEYSTEGRKTLTNVKLQYSSLVLGMRLLQHVPGEGLSFIMTEHEITHKERYVALSYTWQLHSTQEDILQSPTSAATPPTILVNGAVVPVQQNLYDALPHILTSLDGARLWVDFICINQDDIAERSSQVSFMNLIYQKATRVISWLGRPSPTRNTSSAVSLMTRLGSSPVLSYHEDYGPASGRVISWAVRDLTHTVRIDQTSAEAWDGLVELFERPYWCRTWICQEVSASLDTVFFCGEYKFGFRDLAATLLQAQELSQMKGFKKQWLDAMGMNSNVRATVQAMYDRAYAKNPLHQDLRDLDIFRTTASEERQGVVGLLSELRRTACSDARDKVFATSIPAYVQQELKPKIDYTLSIREVFVEAAFNGLTEEGLNFLGHVHTKPLSATRVNSEQSLGLPSWAPDWRERHVPTSLGSRDAIALNSFSTEYRYDPCPGKDKDRANLFLAVTQTEEIFVKGFVVDEVSAVTGSWTSDIGLRRSVQGWHDALKSKVPDFSPVAFLRTLMADVQYQMAGVCVGEARGLSNFDWSLIGIDASGLDQRQQMRQRLDEIRLQKVCVRRQAGITKAGRLGIFPEATVPGDKIFALYGGYTLYILRNMGKRKEHSFVGECYVDGLMDGLAMKMRPKLLKFHVYTLK